MERRKFIKESLLGLAGLLVFPSFLKSEIYSDKNSTLEERLRPIYYEVFEKFGVKKSEKVLLLDGKFQKMYLVYGGQNFRIEGFYDVSTAKNGFGNEVGSMKTPTGIQRVAELYGKDAPYGTMFLGKVEMGKKVKIYSGENNPTKFITSRLIALTGCEEKNKKTFYRSIYLHGTSAEGLIGKKASGGCIRMRNKDVIELFDLIKIGTYVNIWPGDEN